MQFMSKNFHRVVFLLQIIFVTIILCPSINEMVKIIRSKLSPVWELHSFVVTFRKRYSLSRAQKYHWKGLKNPSIRPWHAQWPNGERNNGIAAVKINWKYETKENAKRNNSLKFYEENSKLGKSLKQKKNNLFI